MRASLYCENKSQTALPETCLKTDLCNYCQPLALSADLQYRVESACYPAEDIRMENRFVLPPLQAYFYSKTEATYRGLPPWHESCTAAVEESRIRLIYPSPGSTVFIPREFTGEKERVVFKAATEDADGTLFWHINQEFMGSTQGIHHLEVLLPPGKHRITLWDDRGRELSTWIRISG
jgi:penicillin-binding protein 1C